MIFVKTQYNPRLIIDVDAKTAQRLCDGLDMLYNQAGETLETQDAEAVAELLAGIMSELDEYRSNGTISGIFHE